MSVPPKYRAIGDFHEYYSGVRKAPYLTLFVGGNHEASSYLQELYYGGWAAPNIYYLGAANLLMLGGLKLAGLSGIWKGYNYNKPHFERLPYTADEVKSLYHVREMDVRKLLLIRQQVDIGLSHDWPRGVEWHGDHQSLFRQKSHFESDARDGTLGSTAAKYVMDRLRPSYWLAAHLHCKFAAVIRWDNQSSSTDRTGLANPDEIDIDLDDEKPVTKNNDEIAVDLEDDDAQDVQSKEGHLPARMVANPQSSVTDEIRSQLPDSFRRPDATMGPPPDSITNTTTKFLALDKCLPHRKFLQLMELDPLKPSSSESVRLSYDPEWLSILRVFGDQDPHLPQLPNCGEGAYQMQLEKERMWVEENVVKKGKLEIPENFVPTAPFYDGMDLRGIGSQQPPQYNNPQTSAFCSLAGIRNHFDKPAEKKTSTDFPAAGDGPRRGEPRRFRGRGGRGCGLPSHGGPNRDG